MKTVGPEVDVGVDPNADDGFLDVDLGDGDLPTQSSRVFIRSSAPYIAAQGMERYQNALRNLIPIRRKVMKKDDIGVDHAGLFSFTMSTWLSKLMYKAHRKGLFLDDIPHGSPFDSCDYNVQRLEMLWQEEVRNKGPSEASLSHAVWRFVRTRIIADWFAYLISLILGFFTPMIFMRKLLEFAEDPASSVESGLIWAMLLMFCEILRILIFSWRWVMAYRTSARLRVACLGLVYKKITRLNRFEEKSMGQLINIFGNDSQRIFDVVLLGPMVVGGPLVLVAAVTYVAIILGFWGLAGIAVFLGFYPVQYLISRGVSLLREKTVRVADQRVNLMNEILLFMKTIKMNAWEECFEKQVRCARDNEKKLIQKTSYLSSIGFSLAPTIPIISSIVTFLSHIGAGNPLTAAQAFSTQAVFSNSVRNMIRVMQFGVLSIFEGRISLERIQRLMLIEEIHTRIQRPIDRSQAVSVGGATFSWGAHWTLTHCEVKKNGKTKSEEPIRKSDLEAALEERENLNKDSLQFNDEHPVLHCINFNATKGHLVGVCGPVGSGKTSLLLSILGQMHLIDGQLARDGSCAYVSQCAWITNGTLRDNVLFGEAFMSTRYYAVINSCALNEDLNQFPGGDLTEIGERGINLSGGQKQRVALARALYANKDIYLLDDPLSAVDVTVGAYIFEHYILKELQNKTVVLVTHQIQYLSNCDEIYVMKDGSIAEHGSHEELLKLDKEYAIMVKQGKDLTSASNELETRTKNCHGNREVVKEEVQSTKDIKKSVQSRNAEEGLTVSEPSHTGSVKMDTYCNYISAAGGHFVTFLVLATFLVNIGSTAFSSWWLATWIKAGGGNASIEINNTTVLSTNLADNPDLGFYQMIYASTLGLILLTCGLRSFALTKAAVRASSKIHNELFYKLMHSPMLFFDSNPIGRMQNLFSRDMDEVDNRLPCTIENVISNFWILLFAVLFVCIVFPWFFIAFIILSAIFYLMSKIFRKGIRELKRLENATRSPVFSNLTETVEGLNTIRAFNKEGDYIQRYFQLCDENSTCNYLGNVGNRWLAVRVELLAAISTSITSFFVVALHGVVAPAMAGLALTYSWQISGILQFTTRLISEAEVRFISVERLLAYIEAAVTEGKQTSTTVLSSWPEKGRISFQNVSMSYRPNTPNILCNLSFNILPGEKIGIVGRTGSGKSSLTVALFRIVELNSGSIKLDDIDIAEVALSTLRAKISIIPQDPVLFSGTVRSNLDRRNKCDEKELWDALTKTRLLDRINALPQKLDTVIGDGSAGLSAGERQLLCLARALLKNSKVLILDEATASIDPETETAVQSTVDEEFKSCTVLIIAHRLSTVTNCDRILVMEEGKVVEFDEPNNLLNNPTSLYAKMMASQHSED
ncbi:hypothetical protein ONE63_006086 [Megalurothrips usitatus]|uniref:Multidrug resistance-associated protein 5-like n=1 Tax=Megalurothrips usitatus TaxID=439358 RepID=A0AAV7XWH1_9NEOP|nr:hypothetical protein ONE63_006086 [Megalurothrips usitatus]